jgi:hypothetical protein
MKWILLFILMPMMAFAARTQYFDAENYDFGSDSNFLGKISAVSTANGFHPCPSMTDVQMLAISSPEDGDCVHNTTLETWMQYNAGDLTWGEMGGGGGISQWVTAEDYEIDDVVIETNFIYVCLTAHTSGTFATDLAALKWQAIQIQAAKVVNVPSGNLASTTGQGALNELQGDIDTINADYIDDVEGPASSTDEAVARWDLATGKLLQDSIVTITDAGIISGGTQFNLDNLRLDGNTVSQTGGTNIVISPTAGQYVSNTAHQLVAGFNVNTPSADNTSGSNITITPASKNIMLTNASLVSIDMITSGPFGQEITLINKTGVPVTVNNETGATSAYRIKTNTGASIIIPVEGALNLVFDGTSSRWNTSGIGSSNTNPEILFQLMGLDISGWSTGDNSTFLGGGTIAGTFESDISTPLQGTASYLYTQAAGSLNDYMATPAKSVDLRFRGKEVTFYFPYSYDGADNDIEVIFYDSTNAALIPSSSFIKASTSGMFKTNITIPTTCLNIIVGFHVKVLNSGKILEFASAQMSSDTTFRADIVGPVDSITATAAVSTLTNANLEVEFALVNLVTSSANVIVASDDAASTRTKFTAVRPCTVDVSFSASQITQDHALGVFKNGTQLMRGTETYTANRQNFVSASVRLAAGDYITVGSNGSLTSANTYYFTLTATASSQNVLTAPETFSTDFNTLTYASSSAYTLSTLNTAPIGTFISWTYAINTNTRTQTTTAPTQTTSDMNTNGIQLFARAYNAASTANSPSIVAIQIGKNLKGITTNIYKSTAKATRGTLDYTLFSTDSTLTGIAFKDYNETTGVLILDAGFTISGSVTSRQIYFEDNSIQTNGYVTINGSKNPALTGLNINAVAARGVNTAGTSIPDTTSTTVIFDATKTYDTHSALNNSTGIFTAPETGYYQASWGLLLANSAGWGAGEVIDSFLQKNGANYARGYYHEVEAALTTQMSTLGSSGVYLIKGETLNIQIQQTSGGAIAMLTSSGSNYFSIHKAGSL